jgi:hypothetical protein
VLLVALPAWSDVRVCSQAPQFTGPVAGVEGTVFNPVELDTIRDSAQNPGVQIIQTNCFFGDV